MSKKHTTSRNQIIGAIVLLLMVAVVSFVVHRYPQHDMSPEMVAVADTPMVEKIVVNDTLVLQRFDPNTADSLTLRQLGLQPWQIRNMLHYRAKNGRYRTPDDFSRLYGLTDSAFQVLLPYICIDTMPFHKERIERQLRDSLRRDSIRAHYIALRDSTHRADSLWRDSVMGTRKTHVKRDTIIELNSADTAALLLIRGIGVYTAIRIVEYRDALGGYASVSQLQDKEMRLKYQFPDSLLRCFTVCADSVYPIRVNNASVDAMQHHPYISYHQAESIYNLRRRKIHLDTLQDLESLDCMTSDELVRLAPYLDFSK